MENHNEICNRASKFSLLSCTYCRCGFLTEEDLLKHQQNCSDNGSLSSNSKKMENLHFRTIKQMKNKDSSEDNIIQPGPELPKDQYRRRRAYRAEHKNSWALALEKFKYVKCIYQNCYFIAMSLEDMIAHFGYCNGDGSFAKFVCPYCKGRVTSEAVLLKHIERSHFVEKISVEVDSLINTNGNLYLDSNLETQNSEGTNFKSNENQKIHEMLRPEPCSRNVWQNEINEYGHAYCRKSFCNFMAPSISELEVHLRTCDGTPNFELLNCKKCRYRLPTIEGLTRHVPFCNSKKIKYVSALDNEVNNCPQEDFEIRPVFRQYQNKRPKMHSKPSKVSAPVSAEFNSCDKTITKEDESNLNLKNTNKQKARGRPTRKKENKEKGIGEVKCGKCNFRGSASSFGYHNVKAHVGLGWLEGEEPVNLNDEKLVLRLVKEAFKFSKKAACEKCDDVKRSVLGFVSHIQSCGKSEEEKTALKVQCPHCSGKYLKYSLSAHIKFCHTTPEEGESPKEVEEEVLELSGKRRSAIKAVSKFQQALNEYDEKDAGNEQNEEEVSAHYFVYERGSEKVPKLNSKLNNLWYKLKRERKKIPCRHANCQNKSIDVKEAKLHHYNCTFLPEKVFMCESCDFYSVDESSVQSHVTTHRKYSKQKKILEEEEVQIDEESSVKDEDEEGDAEVEEEDEGEGEIAVSSEEEIEEFDETKKRKKKKDTDDGARKKLKYTMGSLKSNVEVELRLKQAFCRREKIDNVRGVQFYSNGLEMMLQEELLMSEEAGTWPELHTTLEDWTYVKEQEAMRHFPELTKSVNVCFSDNETNWRRFKRFDSDLIEGVPVIFAGGSVRSMSWCKISFKRLMEKSQRQYLAVVTARKLDHLKDVYDRSTLDEASLLQIWDCGSLDNDVAKESPKFSLGIIQKGGKIWDATWFPTDTYSREREKSLKRLGLLATACEDGAVRVWSVCDPDQLGSAKGLPVYKTNPVVVLIADQDVEESCLHVSVGSDGVLAGGFGNGSVAVWNLRNISSPFTKTVGKCKIIRAHLVFPAHKNAITALGFCPSNSRYISTAGLDRFVKVWDLESPSVPVEQTNKEYSLANIWTVNWPLVIYNYDEVMINFNKGAVKFIKDILSDRHQSTFAMEDSCLSLSFSDWLNALSGGSITGEVKLRLLKNLIHDQKRQQSTISSIRLKKFSSEEKKESENSVNRAEKEKNFPRTYEEADLRFGLMFKDNLGMDKGKPKKPEAHPEEFPIRAVNKVAFNPNFKSFTHIAVGYNCGLIRIQSLKELQSSKSLKFFLEKVQKEKF